MVSVSLPAAGLKKKLVLFACIILAYLLIIGFSYPDLFSHFSTHLPYSFLKTHMADLFSIISIIEHNTQAPLHLIYHFPFFYPESYILTRTHPLFGISLIFKVFFMAGLNLEQSFNLFIIFSLVAGTFGCFLLAREFSKKPLVAFCFSTIYLIHNKNLLHFIWPNFLCLFYVPFLFLFLVRYFKTQKKIYALLSGFFLLLQTISSLYYGYQLWVFILPVFLASSWILKICRLKELTSIVAIFLIVAIVLFAIYHPLILAKSPKNKAITEKNSLSATDFFSSSKWLNPFFKNPPKNSLFLYPGFVFLFAFYFYFASHLKKKWLVFFALAALSLSMSLVVFLNPAILDYLFLIFLILTICILISIWKKIDPWEKGLLLTLSFFFLLFISFPHIPLFRSFSLNILIMKLIPFMGFRNMNRVFVIITPLLVVFATLGAEKFIRQSGVEKKIFRFGIPVLLLVLMIGENVHFRPSPHFRSEVLAKPLPDKESDIYRKVPFKKNRILLEIPFYFRFKYKNAIYMLNWRHHQNYLLNAKISYPPDQYYKKLLPILSPSQRNFPTEERLRELIQKYSVTHIIFHLEGLKQYQHEFIPSDNMVSRIKKIKKFGMIMYEDDQVIILRLQEFIPTDTFSRTYSYFHLKNNLILVSLREKYTGRVSVALNQSPVQSIPLDGLQFAIDLKHSHLKLSGNRIKMRFEKKINLEEIEIIGK